MSGTPGTGSRQAPDARQRPFRPVGRALSIAKIDFPPERSRPAVARWLGATLVAMAGALATDALLVAIGTAVFPATSGYVHFRFSDYGKLTAIGVIIACIGWPVVTWISSCGRWLFVRLAILVTLVLWLPDIWILTKGQPPKAVAVLVVMHLAIAVVTYNALVRLAPARTRGTGPTSAPPPSVGRSRRSTRYLFYEQGPARALPHGAPDHLE